MKRLVLHHRYSLGSAWDLSGFDNHGHPRDVTPGATPFDGSFRFDRPSSRIDVRPAASLNGLGGFRCCVRFYLTGPKSRRFNLVESELAFAFFVESGHRLAATILDANGHWTGAFSGGVQPLETPGWHRADCGHDGVSTSWVAFDGQVIAVNENAPGPVRPVGPQGLTVGHWPEPADQYAFDGYISEVWLWQNQPDPPVDDCCVDTEALARAEAVLREQGIGIDDVRRTMRAVGGLGAELRAAVPAVRAQDYDRSAAQLRAALRDQRWHDVGRLSAHLHQHAQAALPDAERERMTGDLLDAIGGLLGDGALAAATADAVLCHPAGAGPSKPDKRRPWTHWGTERDPRADADPAPAPGEIPEDVGYPPGHKPDPQNPQEGSA